MTQPFLIFRAATGALKAAPLGQVARIEELDASTVEWVEDRSVVQYRGALMEIITADGGPAAFDGDTKRPLLVFTRDDSALGLLVDEIVDIVDGPADSRDTSSLVVAGRATELIDVARYWRLAGLGAQVEAAPVVAAPTKRLLVVDQSPFTQLLLGPLLAQAGYSVEVAADPARALALHDDGAVYDLILADTSPSSPHARQMALAFVKAASWHATPLLGLGAHRLDTPTGLAAFAAVVSETLEPLKGAA